MLDVNFWVIVFAAVAFVLALFFWKPRKFWRFWRKDPPENAENTKPEQRGQRVPIIRGIFIILLGLLPLSNALDDVRVQAVRPINLIRLVAAGWCFGMGVGLMIGSVMKRAPRKSHD
jgi:formate hydrogenlyase subunit 3/multisubunit Na+/H+ antiporter MnhD subunit